MVFLSICKVCMHPSFSSMDDRSVFEILMLLLISGEHVPRSTCSKGQGKKNRPGYFDHKVTKHADNVFLPKVFSTRNVYMWFLSFPLNSCLFIVMLCRQVLKPRVLVLDCYFCVQFLVWDAIRYMVWWMILWWKRVFMLTQKKKGGKLQIDEGVLG